MARRSREHRERAWRQSEAAGELQIEQLRERARLPEAAAHALLIEKRQRALWISSSAPRSEQSRAPPRLGASNDCDITGQRRNH